jgi:hypothetical protein
MGIVLFPVGRAGGEVERLALRRGAAAVAAPRPTLRVLAAGRPLYCAACASPVDFAAVWRGDDAFCSVECSLGGGGRPA